MESVWNSFVATYNEPPPNAFKLVNYSRTNPQLPTLTYHEAKQLMDKHPSLSPTKQHMRRHKSTNTQQIKRRQSNYMKKPVKISNKNNKKPNMHQKHQRGGSNKFNLNRTYSFKNKNKSKPLKPLLHQSSSSTSSTGSDTTDITDITDITDNKIQIQTQTSPLPLHIKSRSHSNATLKSTLTKTRKSQYITPKSQTPRHRNKNNSLHFMKNKENKIVLPRLGIVKKCGTPKTKKKKSHEHVEYEQEKRRNPNKKKRNFKPPSASGVPSKNKISIDFQRKNKKKGKFVKPKPINININKQRPISGRQVSQVSQVSHLNIGDHVLLTQDREGIILYIGAVHFAKGIWFGLELINGSIGSHDGIIGHKRYFTSAPKRGLFIQSSKIRRKIRQRDFNASPRQRRHHSLEMMMKLAASAGDTNTNTNTQTKTKNKNKRPKKNTPNPHKHKHNINYNTHYDAESSDDDSTIHTPSYTTPVLPFSDSRLATASPIHVHSHGTNPSDSSTTSTYHSNHSRHSAHYGHENVSHKTFAPVHSQNEDHVQPLPIYDGARHSFHGYTHRNTGSTPIITPQQFDTDEDVVLQLSTKNIKVQPQPANMSGMDIIAFKSLLRAEIETEFQSKFDELKQMLMDKSDREKNIEHKKKARKSKKRKKKKRKKTKRKKKLKEKEKKSLDKLKKMERRRRSKSKTTAQQLKKSEELISSKSDKTHLCVDNLSDENMSDDYEKNSELNITTHSEHSDDENEDENEYEYEEEDEEEEDEIAELAIISKKEHTHGRNISLVSNSSADGFDGLTPTSVQMTDISDFDLDDIRYHVTKQLPPRKHFWGTK